MNEPLFTPQIFPQFSVKLIEFNGHYLYTFHTLNPISRSLVDNSQDVWIFNVGYKDRQPFQKQASALKKSYANLMPLDMLYRDDNGIIRYRTNNKEVRADDNTVCALMQSWIRHDQLEPEVVAKGVNNVRFVKARERTEPLYTFLDEEINNKVELDHKYTVDDL